MQKVNQFDGVLFKKTKQFKKNPLVKRLMINIQKVGP